MTETNRLTQCTDSCYVCKNFELCFLRMGVNWQIDSSIYMFNIDGDIRPGRISDVYTALGSACMKFERKPTDK